MRQKTSITLLCSLAVTLSRQAAYAQTSPAKQVERTLKKVKTRVVRSTSRTTNSVKHAAKAAVNDAKLYDMASDFL